MQTQMNVSLTPQLDRFVRSKVESGRYNSSSEVVREALRLLEERDIVVEAKLAALRADIQEGLNSPHVEWNVEEIKREGRARLAKAGSQQA